MQIDIINILKSSQDFVSGEDISQRLKMSRAAIWKHMQELRKVGYQIDASPHVGYRMSSIPDKLFAWEVQDDLHTDFIGQSYLYENSLPSTMDKAFQLGVEGCSDGMVVCAEGQTKGKGRMGRVWQSPEGKGLYFSIVLRPNLSPTDVSKLTLLTAVSVCEAVRATCPVQPTIKWPNDLLVKGKKLVGVLTEMSAEIDRVRFVVIGIGINVNSMVGDLPEGSTSLCEESGETVSRVTLLKEVLRSLERRYTESLDNGFDKIFQRWRELSSTIGRKVCIKDMNGHVEGKAVDLDEHGGLIIEQKDGKVVKKMSGDVVEI